MSLHFAPHYKYGRMDINEDKYMENYWQDKKFIASGFKMNREDISSKLYPKKAQPFIMKQGDNIFIYYELYDESQNWEIGVLVTSANNFPNGEWKNYEKILVKSQQQETPDKNHIADPTVIYYNNQFHMWFDMCDSHWTLGHATSDDGIHWNKQNIKRITTISLDIGTEKEWDSMWVHAPEVFVYNGELRFIYNGTDLITKNYSSGRMRLENPDNLDSKFVKLGRVTYPNSLSVGKASRLFAPFWYKDKLWAVLSSLGEPVTDNYPRLFYFVTSDNGGKTWEEVGQVPGNLWLHSFLNHNGKLWAVDHGEQHIYYLEE